MLRLQLVVIFLVSALGVSADEPCCQPTVRTRAQMREFTDSSCVCAMYPVWDDGNDNYLYYAEICGGPPSCPIEDVVYFYEGPLVWPQSCATGGDCGDCEGPNPTEKGQGAKDKAPDKFKGLSAKAPWTTTLKDFLPQDNKIKYPDNSGKTASPRKGINDSASFFVIFNANGETVVAKVFVAAADGKDANAPKSRIRTIFIGYEVDPAKPSNLPIAKTISGERVVATQATRKLKTTGNDSENAWVVTVDGRLKFLVLLAQRK